jgi:peptide/nickel transport system substrate-binding protein
MERADRIGIAVLGAAAAALFLLAAAGAHTTRASRYGGVLTVGLTHGTYDTLDPTLLVSFSSVEILRPMCERLYDFDENGQAAPQLAGALPTISPDKRTYTIPLRPGLRFNDGTPFNASAVVTTLERDQTLPLSGRASDLTPIASVTTSGPLTVVIHLSTPYTPLLDTLATNDGIIMSPAQLAKLGDNFGTDPVCVGPFMFDSQTPPTTVTEIKSPYWVDPGAVHLDKIVFETASSGASGVAALQAGDIQVLDQVAPSELSALTNDSSVHLLSQKSVGWDGIQINIGNGHGIGNLPYTKLGTPLASSPLIRQAFEEAIDRTTYLKVVREGQGVPDCTPIPTSSAYHGTMTCTRYDPADARKLVAKSGISNPTVQLLSQNSLQAQFIQAEEAAVGINVVIDPVDNATASSLLLSGNFDAALAGWTGTPDLDRNYYQFLATNGSRNFGGYSNPRLDYVLDNVRKALHQPALKTLYHAALEIIVADRPIIYLDHPIVTMAVSTAVKGVEFLPGLQVGVWSGQNS